MQILQTGMSVLARRRRWRVVEARAYDDCQLVTLTGLGPANVGREARLLVPFDAVEPIRTSSRLRLVPPARWRRACKALLAGGFSQAHLCAAAGARIDLLPHQLEPALALIRGSGCRLLLADDVGLGKTIQAGLAIAELRARGTADRVLVLTPAGLREQWADELERRFEIPAEIVDFQSVARRVSLLPYGVNPWTTWPLAVASIDYVKRAEVLPAVAACTWDALIVDEAHGLAGDSDRHRAVAGLAHRAVFVILLTATPHNGDPRAFSSLCDLGSHGDGDRLLTFRRTRKDIQSPTRRRVHRLLLRLRAAEVRMHRLLAGFGRAVRAEHGDAGRDAWLALAVLHKRAYSSARALQQTVARRLTDMAPEADGPAQLELPLDERGESDAADEPPRWHAALGLRDSARERALLTALADAAERAAAGETKLATLVRLLNRIGEPVIVFTEYRDTLMHVARSIGRPALLLHGGMSRHERSAALRAFAAGDRTILLATDAAGEGLNLQHGCRVVINLELPWNPMRLEQRIGRVDRIGQRRTVHVFHLIAAGTGEERLLDDLRDRIARARADFGAPDPIGPARSRDDRLDVDNAAARLVVGAADARAGQAFVERPRSASAADDPPASLRAAAVAEALRVQLERTRPYASSTTRTVQPEETLATTTRNRHTRLRLGNRILLIWEVRVEDGCGACIQSQTIATAVVLRNPLPRRNEKESIERLIASVVPAASRLVEAAAAPGTAAAIAAVTALAAMRGGRERRALTPPPLAPAFQPGLFDRRVHHAQAALQAARQDVEDARIRRIAMLERQASLSILTPVLRLVLVS